MSNLDPEILLSRVKVDQQNIWFIVRYSNGAVHPDEVQHWPRSKFLAALHHISFWLDQENKNSKG